MATLPVLRTYILIRLLGRNLSSHNIKAYSSIKVGIYVQFSIGVVKLFIHNPDKTFIGRVDVSTGGRGRMAV
jgi:hypothetical protein